MKQFVITLLLLSTALNAQVTGLTGWDIFVDPGHSRKENMGTNGYSEAEGTLQTALHLKDLLMTKTDIDTVQTSRLTDNDLVSLGDRSKMANANVFPYLNRKRATWFHSVHSNAGGTVANNVLLLWGMYGNRTEKVPNGGKAMSDIMVNVMSSVMRIPKSASGSIGDCQFYGCSSGSGIYLSVNRNTIMPSELSEQGFHTNPAQNNRQMNNDYERMVAYSIFWTILDFHGLDRPYPGILTGIVKDAESKVPINGAVIEVNGQTYTTDTYASLFHKYTTNPDKLQNGYYFFEDLPDQAHEVIVSAEGYNPDTLQVADMANTSATYLDVSLTSTTPPYLTLSTPADGDTLVPSWRSLNFRFSRPMNKSSVEAAFSLTPSHTGTFVWTYDKKIVTFIPDDTLAFMTPYTAEIAGSATDTYGHPLDGNKDGTGGDGWTIQFTTGLADMEPPFIVHSYPINNDRGIDLQPVLSVAYNEQIDPTTFNGDMIQIAQYSNGQVINSHAELINVGSQSVINIYPKEWLNMDTFYQIRIFAGLEDKSGNRIKNVKYLNFRTQNHFYENWMIDDFDGDFTSSWWSPKIGFSGSTTGINNDSTDYAKNDSIMIRYGGSSQSMELNYGWDPDVSDWLIRLHLGGGPPQQVKFNSSYTLRAFVFGDGQKNKMRFAVRESNNSIEVSPWTTVDWFGWKEVSWDMANDGTGSWIGDGAFSNPLFVESLQFSHDAQAGLFGTYYIDDLRYSKISTVSTEPQQDNLPSEYSLMDNYPNPFNPWTNIPFTLPESADIRISIYNLRGEEVDQVLSGSFEAGRHLTRWDASNVSSGIYLVKMDANGLSTTRKITVLK